MMYGVGGSVEKVKFTREAAAVSRCHTVPHHGDYTVGHHTFNMLAMLRILWSDAPTTLVWAILEHDVAERLTGDIPAPTKYAGIINRSQLSTLETMVNYAIFGEDSRFYLKPEEEKWFKALDIVELYLWCKDQQMLGNRNVNKMMTRIENFITNNKADLAGPVIDFYYECKTDPWEMMPDLGDMENG